MASTASGIFVQRFLTILLIAALALAAGTGAAEAARKKKARAQPDRYASIVVEAETGHVISERYADKPLHPASLTKMMTLYLTFEAIANGKMRKGDRLHVSSRAAAQEPSKLGLKPGSTIRVEDAILALVTKSANDVAVVLAEALGGSESRFGRIMTDRARSLGMRNTRFVNASGLHHPSQITTARDMATLSRALIAHYPREYRYFSTKNFYYAGASHHNHNRLMSAYDGMDGIKTGFIYASGYNLAASAKRDGQRLIGVVFGGRTAVTRNNHMAQILDNGFAQLRNPVVAERIRAKAVGQSATQLASAATNRHTAGNFDALALVEQGDTSEDYTYPQPEFHRPSSAANDTRARVVDVRHPVPQQKPVELASAAQAMDYALDDAEVTAAPGSWSVQVGAFSTHNAGMTALRGVRGKLPQVITKQSRYTIAPLKTARGMVYRARITGLDRHQATEACRILRGNCLILAAQ